MYIQRRLFTMKINRGKKSYVIKLPYQFRWAFFLQAAEEERKKYGFMLSQFYGIEGVW